MSHNRPRNSGKALTGSRRKSIRSAIAAIVVIAPVWTDTERRDMIKWSKELAGECWTHVEWFCWWRHRRQLHPFYGYTTPKLKILSQYYLGLTTYQRPHETASDENICNSGGYQPGDDRPLKFFESGKFRNETDWDRGCNTTNWCQIFLWDQALKNTGRLTKGTNCEERY